MITVFLFLFILEQMVEVSGHGMLIKPPARNTMWRYGYKNPVNYNDNELYCGGFVVHYQKNGGKCGVCGDNYSDKPPRKHEYGGLYGNQITVAQYTPGQSIDIEVRLTTNHWGIMVIKFCPEEREAVTQECFDRHVLPLSGGGGTEFHIPRDTKRRDVYFNYTVDLPPFIECTTCAIQWTYMAGNTWAECADGTGSVGCGDQETFVNCADVSVASAVTNIQPGGFNPWGLYVRAGQLNGIARPRKPTSSNEIVPLVVTALACEGVGFYKHIGGMNGYCNDMCLRYPPKCHTQVCRCYQECDPIGEFALVKDAEIFCNQNCLRHPSHCPEDKCYCY